MHSGGFVKILFHLYFAEKSTFLVHLTDKKYPVQTAFLLTFIEKLMITKNGTK